MKDNFVVSLVNVCHNCGTINEEIRDEKEFVKGFDKMKGCVNCQYEMYGISAKNQDIELSICCKGCGLLEVYEGTVNEIPNESTPLTCKRCDYCLLSVSQHIENIEDIYSKFSYYSLRSPERMNKMLQKIKNEK